MNSSNHSGRPRKRSSESRLPFLFEFWCWVVGFVSRQFPGASSSLRSVAGLQDGLDESGGIDVEGELVPELDDNPGTTRGTKLSVDRWPTHRSICVLRRVSKRQNCRRVFEKLHSHEEAKIVKKNLCFCVCLHFSIGRFHRCGGPGSVQSVQFFWGQILFFLSMCIGAPESTTNSRFSGDCAICAGATLISIGE